MWRMGSDEKNKEGERIPLSHSVIPSGFFCCFLSDVSFLPPCQGKKKRESSFVYGFNRPPSTATLEWNYIVEQQNLRSDLDRQIAPFVPPPLPCPKFSLGLGGMRI